MSEVNDLWRGKVARGPSPGTTAEKPPREEKPDLSDMSDAELMSALENSAKIVSKESARISEVNKELASRFGTEGEEEKPVGAGAPEEETQRA